MNTGRLGVAWTLVVGAALVAGAGSARGAEEDGETIETIVVTAQRRAQSIQEVPLSITALSAEEIERAGVAELQDYGVRIPNLVFSAAGSSSTDGAMSIAIRGVFGLNTTGFYIDDSPLLAALNPRVIDLERIEVLRGPQGTLYGARSMGGTVRLITTQPDLQKFSARAHALGSSTTDGGFNYLIDGALNMPVVPGVFGLRAVVYHDHDDGFIDRAPRSDAPASFPVRHDINSEQVSGAQLAALWSGMDGRLTVTPRVMYERVKRDGRTQADFSADNRVNLRQFDIPEPSESKWWLTTLTGSYDADFGSFLAATSWFRRDYSDTEDFSEWTTAVLQFQGASVTYSTTEQSIFSQELRFVSSWDAPVDLTAGLFYQHSKSTWRFPYTSIDGFSDDAFNLDNPTTIKEQAAFAEVTWHVMPSLRLILGGRAFENKVDFHLRQGGDFIGPDQVFDGKQEESGFTPRLGVQYDLGRDAMVYATMSEGFRIGGVNFYADSLCAAEIQALGLGDVSTYKSDSLRNYELGLKSQWLERRLTVNAAAFQIDWEDLQQRQGLACGFTLNVNAGKARLRGTEVEIQFPAGERGRVTAGAGYIDSEITDNGGLSTVTEGQRVQNVPKLTWNVAYEQGFRLFERPSFLRFDYGYTGSSLSGNNSPTNLLRRPAFEVANLRLGTEFGLDEVSLFAKNLFDEASNFGDIPPLGVQTPGRPRIVVNQPRTIGLEWRRRF